MRADLRPSLEPPSWLAEQTLRHQMTAPYCGVGFRKDRLDPEVYRRVFAFYQANVARFRPEREIGVVCSENARTIPALYFEDRSFNDWLSGELQAAHEAWCGMRLERTYCYGIRVYQRGTFLHTHVDRPTTHIISSTICVDHRLNGRWPLHIEDVDGTPTEIDLEPGEFVFYEGSRLKHGRPYPLDGDYYAGIFVHYRPAGWSAADPRAC